jgi:hypothetical protein
VVVALAVIGVIFLTGGFGRRPIGPGVSSPPSSQATNPASPSTKPGASLPGPRDKGLLYEDDFSDPASGWRKISDETMDSNYDSGEYSLSVKKWNWGDWIVNRNAGKFADMTLDIDARLVSGSFQSGYGVIFRAQNDDSFYRCLVTGQGEFAIQKRIGGVVHVLQKYIKSPFINQGNASNHLKIVCKGSQIDLACNGHSLVNITDDSFPEGFVGVAVSTVEPPATAHFDNLKIFGGN